MQIHAIAAEPRPADRAVGNAMLAVRALRVRRQRRHHEVLDVGAVERRFAGPDDAARHPEDRGLARDEQQVARRSLHHQHEPRFEARAARQHATRSFATQLVGEPIEVVEDVHGFGHDSVGTTESAARARY